MLPRKLRCLFRRHQWHNGWDAEKHETVWTCKRCGLIRSHLETGQFPLNGRWAVRAVIFTRAVHSRRPALIAASSV